jgi:hypothetical protein
MNILVANVFTLVLLFLVRFVIADAAIYARPRWRSKAADAGRREPEEVRTTGSRKHRPRLPDIGTFLQVRHPRHVDDRLHVELPELEYFRAMGRKRRRPGHQGGPRRTQLASHTRAQMTQCMSPSGLCTRNNWAAGRQFQSTSGTGSTYSCLPPLPTRHMCSTPTSSKHYCGSSPSPEGPYCCTRHVWS